MRPVELSGTVKKYSQNGRKLGYPTANISTATNLKDGVYFGYASLADYKNNPAMIFIGVPTTMGDTERRVEAHLLEVEDRDYYDQEIFLDIRHFHRNNQKFETIKKLQEIMIEDEIAAKNWFT